MDEATVIQLSHRSLLQPKFTALGLQLSEYTFANIYLFRQVHRYELVSISNRIFILGISYDSKKFLMPTYDITFEEPSFLKFCLEKVDMFFPIPRGWAEMLASKGFSTTCKDGDSDYIYSIETIQTYAGRHLAGRRNLVTQFKDHYEVEFQPITSKVKDEALSIVLHWEQQTNKAQPQESQSCREAIEHIEELALFGLLFTINKKPVGLIIGEPLVDKGLEAMFVLHFAKADTQYKGIYQYMYQEYAKQCGDYRFLNWEQDLGDHGLQQAKRAYMPHHLITKMRVSSIT